MNKVSCILIQARVYSSRFPFKVLYYIDKLPSIVYQYKRISSTIKLPIYVLIPDDKVNDILADCLKSFEIPFFRGSLNNVYKRFMSFLVKNDFKYCFRINADCPLISPSTIIDLINFSKNLNSQFDYISTVMDSSFPIGEHVEFFKVDQFLNNYDLACKEEENLEHVTPVFYKNKNLFKCIPFTNKFKSPDKLRLCVDYPEDLKVVRSIVSYFSSRDNFSLIDIVNLFESNKMIFLPNLKISKKRTM